MADPSDEREENRGGRPVCLDENKRRKIIALLANGSSRRVAARYVGARPARSTARCSASRRKTIL